MEDFKIKVGDLIRLRDDLEDRKEYGSEYYVKNMNFKGFRKIKERSYNGKFVIICDIDFPYHYTKEMIAEVKRPTKYETIYKREEPILDEKEKEYLGNLIRPFRDRVTYIAKRKENKTKLFIHIQLKDDWGCLPDFKENTMYKNMKIDKSYTLEELGL